MKTSLKMTLAALPAAAQNMQEGAKCAPKKAVAKCGAKKCAAKSAPKCGAKCAPKS